MPNPTRMPLFAMGFRPFFLLGALEAILLVGFWVGALTGLWRMPSQISMIDWHSHEMLFGFALAIVAGFLSTASANWTRTRGAHGATLIVLVGFWLLGRLAFWWIALGGNPAFAWLDLMTLPTLLILLAGPLWKARKWTNLAFLFWLLVMFFGHLLILAEFTLAYPGYGRKGIYLGLDVVLLLILIIGGRILPFFTKNALPHANARKQPRLDRIALLSGATFVFIEFFCGTLHTATGISALLTGILSLARMRTWGTFSTLREPILWILHLAFAWLSLAFLSKAAACFGLLPLTLATHMFTAGAMGIFILGMISRVSLGHTGRALQLSRTTVFAYIAILLAAIARTTGPLLPSHLYHISISTAGCLWVLAFGLFLFVYTPILTRTRADGKEG